MASSQEQRQTQLIVTAIDPGRRHLAAWRGALNMNTGRVTTLQMTLFDVEQSATRGRSAPNYEFASDVVRANLWLLDSDRVVIETQKPGNVMGRVIAAAFYASARMAPRPSVVHCSAPGLKRKGAAFLRAMIGEGAPEAPLAPTAPTRGGGRKRRRPDSGAMASYEARKEDAVVIVGAAADMIGMAAWPSAGKRDDLADAVLLGVGEMAGVMAGRRGR